MPGLISIHALRKESDILRVSALFSAGLFQSTLSVRRATVRQSDGRAGIIISIHALRKESDLGDTAPLLEVQISIHALRKESDQSISPWIP